MPDLEFPWAGETPRERPRYDCQLAELLAAYAAVVRHDRALYRSRGCRCRACHPELWGDPFAEADAMARAATEESGNAF